MTSPALLDASLREQALNPRLCCIVQAPAGSGKTELLIQRILVLLANVERPEEILALTFTKKAAGEMRTRVIKALREAEHPLSPSASPHLLQQRERARAALQRDREQGWNLLQQPARLGIQTIDSLCASLAARLPLTAGFGAPSRIDSTPHALYLEAATNLLERIEAPMDDDDIYTRALETLLPHLGNNLARVRDLLAAMLAKRDQWLRHTQHTEQKTLENALQNLLNSELNTLQKLFPERLKNEISTLAATLCANLEAQGVDDADLRMNWQIKGWPKAEVRDLPRWQGLAEHLLTITGSWRKSVTSKNGVPSPSDKGISKEEKSERTAFKNRLLQLLGDLSEQPELAHALHQCRSIPAPHYPERDWRVLAALLQLLNLAVAELNVIFGTRGAVDFVENALAAQRTLGLNDEEASEVWLALDYRLRHILVDEFQDTSTTQLELLKKLIAGWQSGESAYSEYEGRSLFLVGDPMQSIYRFREAEVGLFLQAQRKGVGGLKLKALELSTNFRSQAGIVAWVNRVFPQVLAQSDELNEGAVRYAKPDAIAFHPKAKGAATCLHLLDKPDKNDQQALERGKLEAAHVVALAQSALASLLDDGEQIKASDQSVAILVRSRSHLAQIIPALRAANLAFQAVEIEQLADQPMVHDLLALTRALLHPADRIAWLAVLRAPWCGLRLGDLHTLTENQPKATLWQLMQDEERLAMLTDDARTRLLHIRAVLARGQEERGRIPLRRQVEGVWLALGGAQCVRQPRELIEADIFFELLDRLHHEFAGVIEAWQLEQELQKLYAPPDAPKAGQALLQLMTIHKAKGLQFHTVILPGLARTPPNSDSRLLIWHERENEHQHTELLLAPIRAVGENKDKKAPATLYSWLQKMDATREAHETGRLLYVAATRAIQRLHLVAEAPRDQDGAWKAPARSLLDKLWPGIEFMLDAASPTLAAPLSRQEGASEHPSASAQFRRIANLSQAPQPPAAIAMPPPEGRLRPFAQQNLDKNWHAGDETPRHVGTLLHRLFERIALDGLKIWDTRLQAHAQLSPMLRRELTRLGVARSQLERALESVFTALTNTLQDPRGRWILTAHEDAHCEWALGGLVDHISINAPINAHINVVIDRSFIDNGTRWIIDYKTAAPMPDENMENFLERQQELYRQQLESYAALLRRQNHALKIQCGLYFPALAQWRAW